MATAMSPLWTRRILGAVFCAVLALCAAQRTRAQETPPAQIQTVDMPLVAWVSSRAHALPDFAVNADRIAQFRALLESLLDRNHAQALGQAQALGYLLVRLHEGGSSFVIASDDSGAGRDPTVVINENPRRDFIAEAPHVPFEPGTGEQALIFLKGLGGRAAIISGAHRCASRTFTACDGTTEVCAGAPQGYRDSDAGHNVDTLFHAGHVLFAQRWREAVVMALHGMKEDADGVRTSLIVSNGIRAEDAAAQTAATRFRLALNARIREPGRVVSCNLPADDVFNARKLCGYTNVQGRQVNGDDDACRGSVDQGTGRFIHMEQDWNVLRPYSQNWQRIGRHHYNRAFMDALARALPLARKL
jgi:hypothetical protein